MLVVGDISNSSFEYINMGSSFEDPDATNPTTKTHRFKLKKYFEFSNFTLNVDDVSNSVFMHVCKRRLFGAHRCDNVTN